MQINSNSFLENYPSNSAYAQKDSKTCPSLKALKDIDIFLKQKAMKKTDLVDNLISGEQGMYKEQMLKFDERREEINDKVDSLNALIKSYDELGSEEHSNDADMLRTEVAILKDELIELGFGETEFQKSYSKTMNRFYALRKELLLDDAVSNEENADLLEEILEAALNEEGENAELAAIQSTIDKAQSTPPPSSGLDVKI